MAPKFVKFVRCVEGRLVGRWDVGSAHYFGARLGSNAERADDKPIVWDTDVVTPLTQEFCVRFGRELARALRLGDLKSATEEEYSAWLKLEETRETEAEAERRAAEAAKVAKPATEVPSAAAEPAQAAAAPPPDPPPAAEAPAEQPKAEKRK